MVSISTNVYVPSTLDVALRDPGFPLGTLESRFTSDLIGRGGRLIEVRAGAEIGLRAVVGPRPDTASREWYLGRIHAALSEEVPPAELWLALVILAEQTALSAGASGLVAPLDESSWHSYRLREDDGPRSFDWEPARRPELKAALLARQFEHAEHYWTAGTTDLAAMRDRSEPAYARALAAGYVCHDAASWLTSGQRNWLLKSIWAICNRAFAGSAYFAPISFTDFCAYYANGLVGKRTGIGHIILAPSGEVAAFLWSYLEADLLIYKSMAVDQAFQGQRLGDAVMHPVAALACQRGITNYVSALMIAGNKSEFAARRGQLLWHHDYFMWRKVLAP